VDQLGATYLFLLLVFLMCFLLLFIYAQEGQQEGKHGIFKYNSILFFVLFFKEGNKPVLVKYAIRLFSSEAVNQKLSELFFG
jgi:hypothetical protein